MHATCTVFWVLISLISFGSMSLGSQLALKLIAGSGVPQNNGNSGPALTTNLGEPFGVELGPDGSLYITEVRNHRIWRFDPSTQSLTAVVGCGRKGYAGDGGPAVEAELNEPYEVRFDGSGNMYFVEMQNHVIRRVDHQTQRISTIAGTGQPGFQGDGGSAVKALLRQPHSIALDAAGAIYVADIGNHRIRRIDPRTGVIETIAGSSQRMMPQEGQVAQGNALLGPRALYIQDETLWVALREGHSVWKMDLKMGTLHHVAGTGMAGYSGDGGPAKRAQFNGPKGIAVDPDGNIFVADTENNAIRQIDAKSGNITTLIGPNQQGAEEARASGVRAVSLLNRPHGICVGPKSSVYIGDTLNHRVWRTP